MPTEDLDTTGYVGSMPPNGTFRRELIAEDLIAAGLDPQIARANEQVLTLVLDDGRFTYRWGGPSNPVVCEGTYRSVGGGAVLEFVNDAGSDPECGDGERQAWREEPDGISFITLNPTYLPSDHILLDRWVWTRIE